MTVIITPGQAAHAKAKATRQRLRLLAADVAVQPDYFLNGKKKEKTADRLRTDIYEACEGQQERIKAKTPAELDERLAGLVATFHGRNGFLLQAMQTAQREAANAKAKANELWANKYQPATTHDLRAAVLAEIEGLQRDAVKWLELAGVMAALHESETAMGAAGVDISEVEAIRLPLRQVIATHRAEQYRQRATLPDMTKALKVQRRRAE